jgi:hypothetical protein
MVNKYPDCRVFIRKVCEDGINYKKVPEEDQNIDRLHFFKNYYELSEKFAEIGIFTQDDLQRVARQSALVINQDKNANYSKFYTNIPGVDNNVKGADDYDDDDNERSRFQQMASMGGNRKKTKKNRRRKPKKTISKKYKKYNRTNKSKKYKF